MITIKDVQKVTGWSYPTALKFIEKHGEMTGGKWFMDAAPLSDYVQTQLQESKEMAQNLKGLEANSCQ